MQSLSEPPIPAFDLSRQHARLLDELTEAARQVLASGQMILGERVRQLEQELARQAGVPHAIGVASGTDGLYLALKACGVKPGDEVVTTPFTFIATVTSIIRAGARPVLADVDPDTLNLDPDRAQAALTPRTRALLVVHLFGNPAPMDAFADLARRHGLALIEDMAQAIGASYGGRPVGSFGDAGVVSFYPTKNLGGCGDGGMVLTARPDVAERVSLLRLSGSRRRYLCDDPDGINSRLDELQAALLLVKLQRLDAFNRRRREIASLYRHLLEGLPVVPLQETPGGMSVYHQFTIRAPRRDDLASWLAARGIGTAVYYPVPLHLQPAVRARCAPVGSLPVAERAAAEVLSLPMFPELTDPEVERVAAAVREFCQKIP